MSSSPSVCPYCGLAAPGPEHRANAPLLCDEDMVRAHSLKVERDTGDGATYKTADQWKAWFVQLRDTHEDWQVLDSIADMGEQVNQLHQITTAMIGYWFQQESMTVAEAVEKMVRERKTEAQ